MPLPIKPQVRAVAELVTATSSLGVGVRHDLNDTITCWGMSGEAFRTPTKPISVPGTPHSIHILIVPEAVIAVYDMEQTGATITHAISRRTLLGCPFDGERVRC
jgi:hypothetical protein